MWVHKFTMMTIKVASYPSVYPLTLIRTDAHYALPQPWVRQLDADSYTQRADCVYNFRNRSLTFIHSIFNWFHRLCVQLQKQKSNIHKLHFSNAFKNTGYQQPELGTLLLITITLNSRQPSVKRCEATHHHTETSLKSENMKHYHA